MIETKPLTVGTIIKILAFVVILALLAALTWHADAESPQTVTAIDCHDGRVGRIHADAPLVVLELKHNGHRWLWPERIPLHRLRYTLTLDDGSEMLVGIAYDYGKPTSAYGMWWKRGEPDWRNIGDGQPHPERIVGISTRDAVRLLATCD